MGHASWDSHASQRYGAGRSAATHAPRRGCDHWNGSHYCGQTHVVTDEVTEELFCEAHAGPLGWDAKHINLYSLALKTSARMGVVYQMPEALRAQLYPDGSVAA